MLEKRQHGLERLEIVLGRSNREDRKATASKWTENVKEERLYRTICIPDAMTLVDGLRAVGGYSEAELDRVAELQPGRVHCGTMLAIRR
jgi:hypothetical protein